MVRSARVKTQPTLGRSDVVASEEFRTIAELRGDIAWIIDCASGLPTYVSAALATLLGYDEQDIADHLSGHKPNPVLTVLCHGLPDRLARFAAGDLSRRRVVRRYEQRHKLGHNVPIEVISTLLCNEQGVPVSLVGLIRDATEEHQRADKQRRFASMLNHEFRTPLSTIDGAIQRLESTHTQADEATRQRYRKIQGAVDRLIVMMDDYLSPERLEQIGQQRPADLADPRALLDEAAVQVRKAGRTAQVDGAALPDSLRCQPQGVRMALQVLVANALRYSPPDSTVALSGALAGGGVTLLVRDHGSGVPEEETGLIFGKHYRASNASGPGAGLGLYMARSVIEVMGGSVSMRNIAPEGAEFRIWLPVRPGQGKSVASDVTKCDNSLNQ